jgi:hypothetical protein
MDLLWKALGKAPAAAHRGSSRVGPARQDVRGEAHLPVNRHLGSVADLVPGHRNWTDPALDQPLRPGAMQDNPLAVIGQKIIVDLGDKVCSLRPQRRRQHLARALTSNLGQRIKDRTRLVKRRVRLSWLIAPSGGSGRLQHPLRHAAFSGPITHVQP